MLLVVTVLVQFYMCCLEKFGLLNFAAQRALDAASWGMSMFGQMVSETFKSLDILFCCLDLQTLNHLLSV